MRILAAPALLLVLAACSARSSSDSASQGVCTTELDRYPVEETVAPRELVPLRDAILSALPEAGTHGDIQLRVRRDRDTTEVVPAASTVDFAIAASVARAVRRVLPAQPRDSFPPAANTGGEKDLRGRDAFSLLITVAGTELTRIEGEQLPMCRPDLVNIDEVRQIITRAAGSVPNRGTVVMWLLVGESGQVQRVQVSQSSGDEIVDAIGSTVGYAARFVPATIGGEPVRVWVQIPVTIR